MQEEQSGSWSYPYGWKVVSLPAHTMYLKKWIIVDREIFTLKIIRVKNFRVDKFSRFVQSVKFLLTVEGYIMTSAWSLLPGIGRASYG